MDCDHAGVNPFHCRWPCGLPRLLLVFGAVVLPWLNPMAAGPMPSLVSELLAWLGMAIVLLVSGYRVAGGLPWGLGSTIALAWLLAALFSAGLGLLQYFGASLQLEPWFHGGTPGEAYANLRQRNQFATLTNLGLAALLWWAGRLPARWASWTGIGLAAALLATANAASASRIGALQLLVLGGLVWWWGGWQQAVVRRALMAALAAYAVALLALPWAQGQSLADVGLIARLGGEVGGCQSRLVLWRNVLQLIGERPWTGWGWGELDYAHFMTLYEGPRFCGLLDNAHNLPLHLAVELGIPVALLSCAVLGGVVIKARPWQEQDATRQLAWAVLTMILLHSLVEYPLWYGPFQMTVGLCLGLLWPRLLAPRCGRWAWHRLAALSLLATVAYAAWDYHRISQIYLAPEQRAAAYRDNTLEKIRASHLFQGAVRFAELTLAPLTLDNAVQVNAEAHALLHFSPEPRVIEKLIESAVLLGRDGEARDFMRRYRAAYPQAYDDWRGRAAAAAAN